MLPHLQTTLAVLKRIDRIWVRFAKTRVALILVLLFNVFVLWAFVFVERGGDASEPVRTGCSHFDTWQEAETYWNANQDDVRVLDGLDSNGNGIPCESRVDYPDADLPPVDMRLVCDDFDFWEQAQGFFDTWVDEFPELRSLDGDRNGVACQDIPAHEDIISVVKRLNRLERAGLR